MELEVIRKLHSIANDWDAIWRVGTESGVLGGKGEIEILRNLRALKISIKCLEIAYEKNILPHHCINAIQGLIGNYNNYSGNETEAKLIEIFQEKVRETIKANGLLGLSRDFSLNKFNQKNIERSRRGFGMDPADWPEMQYGCAIAGETGELCNLLKKVGRGDDIANDDIRREVGDIVIYLDLFCSMYGFTLEECIVYAFNKKSKDINTNIYI